MSISSWSFVIHSFSTTEACNAGERNRIGGTPGLRDSKSLGGIEPRLKHQCPQLAGVKRAAKREEVPDVEHSFR
jgi:hypothetical protein